MIDNRPAPPSAVKRQLRQEAGFGCCFCGHSFLQYHHIVPWAEEAHFRPDDMMAVCGQCHYLLTVGAILQEDQRKAKMSPKNIVDGLFKGQLFVTSSELKVSLGGGTATETPCLLKIRGQSVLSAKLSSEHGRVLVSAIIHDQSGQAIGQLIDNDWTMLPGAVWDFEAHPRHAKVRTDHGNIAFAVDARNDIVSMQGKWFSHGDNIEFTPSSVRWGTNTFHAFSGAYNLVHVALG